MLPSISMIENIFFPPNISLVCRTSLAVCHLSTTLSILHMEFYVALTAIRMMEIFFLVLLLLLAALFTTRSPISKPSQCHIPELSKKWSNVYIRCRFTFAIFYSKSQRTIKLIESSCCRWFESKMLLSGVGKYGNFVTTQFQYTKNAV